MNVLFNTPEITCDLLDVPLSISTQRVQSAGSPPWSDNGCFASPTPLGDTSGGHGNATGYGRRLELGQDGNGLRDAHSAGGAAFRRKGGQGKEETRCGWRPYPTSLSDEVLAAGCDFLVKGEGENTIPLLLKALEEERQAESSRATENPTCQHLRFLDLTFLPQGITSLWEFKHPEVVPLTANFATLLPLWSQTALQRPRPSNRRVGLPLSVGMEKSGILYAMTTSSGARSTREQSFPILFHG